MPIDDPGAAFKFVAGRLCLDLINTVSGRGANPEAAVAERDYADVVEKERLVGFDDLVRWGQAAGVLGKAEATELARAARAEPAQASHVVRRARVLREAMYRLFRAMIEGWKPDATDLAVLNRELGQARAHERLAAGKRGLTWTWKDRGSDLDRVLWPTVRSAAALLTSDELTRVRQCDGEDCRWLFLDTSKNRSRRWCEMADCGNRAKVRRFRRRH